MSYEDRDDYLVDADDDDLEELNEFDVEMDDDDDEESRRVSKKRVSQLISKVKNKERGKYAALAEQFKKVYGVSPEEAIQFGWREAQQYHQQGAPQPQPQPQYQEHQQQQQEVDPVVQKVMEIDQWRYQEELRRQREREAMEFVQLYPNVKFQDIPREVIERRARGGLSLAESYKLHMADQRVNEAARNAAQSTARNIRQRDVYRTEGQDFGGVAGDEVGSLSPEEREFAKNFGMSTKAYAAQKIKLAKMREEGGY